MAAGTSSMQENPLRKLKAIGQSIWLDFIDRALLSTGKLTALIEADGLAGLTSNPAIFEKAMGHAGQYDDAIRAALGERLDIKALYEALALEDVQAAADSFAAVYAATRGADGFVSLEVSPYLADDTDATIREAKRLWAAFDRPNAMIKVPATRAGLGAITNLVAAGVNVNVTLLFGMARYREVVDAFITGLERRAVAGGPVDQQASVASFFLSRIDTLIDAKLEALDATEARALRGQAAIAAARLGYQYYRQWTASDRWRRLADVGARPQRLLWASTSTKDPAYSDVKYVEALIGPETVNTVPLQTLDAYRKHGHPVARLETDLLEAMALPDALTRCGINLDDVSDQLEREGVRKFVEAFDQLLASLERRAWELQPRG
jgi:transaldolase